MRLGRALSSNIRLKGKLSRFLFIVIILYFYEDRNQWNKPLILYWVDRKSLSSSFIKSQCVIVESNIFLNLLCIVHYFLLLFFATIEAAYIFLLV